MSIDCGSHVCEMGPEIICLLEEQGLINTALPAHSNVQVLHHKSIDVQIPMRQSLHLVKYRLDCDLESMESMSHLDGYYSYRRDSTDLTNLA